MENKSNNDTISLAEAKRHVTNWLKAAIGIFDNKIDQVPRGFFVPIEAIKSLANNYPDAVGVQVYFTLKTSEFKPGEGISGILVPVEQQANGLQRDMIDPEIDEDDAADSSIYNFTRACPPLCNSNNELFITI